MVDLAFQPQPQQEATVVPELAGQGLQRTVTGAAPSDLPDQARRQRRVMAPSSPASASS
jgi:hypothetical protein